MITVTRKVHFTREAHGQNRIERGQEPEAPVDEGRVPRVAKLMALAIRFEKLLADGVVKDQSDLARLAHVSQPRVTQILNLLHLAPDIQEAVLFLPRVIAGRAPVTEKTLRPIAAETDWNVQRGMWGRSSA